MLGISLYQSYCILLCKHIKLHSYHKNQCYRTDREATSGVGGRFSQRQESCFSHTLPNCPLNIIGLDIEVSRGTDRELEQQANDDLIDLYFGDESHIYTERYVPYDHWQFRGKDMSLFLLPRVLLGSSLAFSAWSTATNHYDGFRTRENITVDKIAEFRQGFLSR